MHTHLPAYLEIHVFAVGFFFFFFARRELCNSSVEVTGMGTLASRSGETCLSSVFHLRAIVSHGDSGTGNTAADKVLSRKKTRVGFPGIAGCFIAT